MRAVIYARYSTDLQRAASIEDQVRLCRARIEREGWTLESVYTDHATSGASRLRPGYQKLLEDARAACFDVVVAEAMDRLSRDQEDIAALYKQLSFSGVRLSTIAEGEVSELHVGLKGTMNALFLKDLAAKTHRGLEGRVRAGRSAGGLCYGYDVVKERDATGEPIRGVRRINAEQAVIVHRIFQEFAGGRSPRAIAAGLNRDYVPGPMGRIWRDTTIRGHAERGTGILHNELYVGRLVWNRLRYVKDPATGKRVSRANPRAAWIIEEVPDLRIVDEALWAAVEERLQSIRNAPGTKKIRESAFWTQRRPRHLLTGLVFCGCCGNAMSAAGKDYLACATARRAGACDNRRSMRRSVLEDLILDALRTRLMEPDLVAEFVRAFGEEVNRARRDADQDRERGARAIATLARKIDGLIEAIAEGYRSEGLQEKLAGLEAEKAELEAAHNRSPERAPRLHPNLAEVYRKKVADLHEALRIPETRDEAFAHLRSLVERVELSPSAEGFTVSLTGDIASMLTLPGHGKRGDVPGLCSSSVKVVAGVGFEPTTFRL